MVRYESRVVVDRPVDVVFPYLIEHSKQALWSDVPMRQVTPGPLGEGSRVEVSFGMGPIKATIGLELTAVEPGQRLAFASYSGPIRWDGEYRLAAAGSDRTELSQTGTLRFTGLWRLVEPLAGAEISRAEVKELEKLKAVVEAS